MIKKHKLHNEQCAFSGKKENSLSVEFLNSEPCGNIHLWQSRKHHCLLEADKDGERLKQAGQLAFKDEGGLSTVRDLLEEPLVHLLVVRPPRRLPSAFQHIVFADLPVKAVFQFILRRREVIYRL